MVGFIKIGHKKLFLLVSQLLPAMTDALASGGSVLLAELDRADTVVKVFFSSRRTWLVITWRRSLFAFWIFTLLRTCSGTATDWSSLTSCCR